MTERLTESQRKLVGTAVDLVRRLARAFSRRLPVAEDDLVSAGNEALTGLAIRFDESRGIPFGAYASTRLKGAMLDEANRIMGGRLSLASALQRGEVSAEAEGENRVSLDELLAGSATSPRAEATTTLQDRIASFVAQAVAAHDRGPEHELIRLGEYQFAVEAIHRALADLREPDRSVIQAIYWERKTLETIAAELGVTTQTAWRAHDRSKPRLREALLLVGVTSAAIEEG